MKDLNLKQLIIIGAIAVVVVFTIGVYIYKMANKSAINYDEDMLETLDEVEENTEDEDAKNEDNKIMVHVTGCVENSGIVVLEEGDRIIDAIEAAGGEKEDADLNKLNLAYVLKDGDKLYVPSKLEDKEDIEYISGKSGDNVVIEGAGKTMEDKEVININTATKAELVTLNGIGDATADKIIAYRQENGKFKTIEDLKKVPGIGDSKFENIKSKITV